MRPATLLGWPRIYGAINMPTVYSVQSYGEKPKFVSSLTVATSIARDLTAPSKGGNGDAIIRVHETWNRRISTGKLNRWLGAVIEKTPPPAVSGWRIKIRYMTQAKARPPHFVIFGNQLDELPTSYERFLINGMRETFDLKGVPIRITKRMPKNPYEGRKRR
jgi:predicted GTPase